MQRRNLTMMMNRIMLLVLFAAASALQGQQAETKARAFKLVSATSNVFYPGVQGSPITRRVELVLVAKRKGTLSFDSGWYAGQVEKAYWYNAEMQPIGKTAVKRGDTIRVSLVFYQTTWDSMMPETDHIPGSLNAEKPVPFDGEFILRYDRNGCRKYFGIQKLTRGAEVYAP